jgi:hypothetical protein
MNGIPKRSCGIREQDHKKTGNAAMNVLSKDLPAIGMLLIIVAFVAASLLVIIPVVQYSGQSPTPVQEAGTTARIQAAPVISLYSLNQPATDGRLEITLVTVTDGVMVTPGKKILHVTANLHNLLPDKPLHIAADDFTLIDAGNREYPLLAVAGRDGVDIRPLDRASVDLSFEVPEGTTGPKIWYSFPLSTDSSGKSVLFGL